MPRISARAALSTNPLATIEIQFEARSFRGKISARVCNVLFCKVALRVRPSSHDDFAGLGVDATSVSNSRDTACTRHPGSYSGADNRSKCATRCRRDLDRADTRRLAPYSPADSRSKFANISIAVRRRRTVSRRRVIILCIDNGRAANRALAFQAAFSDWAAVLDFAQ